MIIDLGVMMKRGSKLFIITQELEAMKVENLFSLIYDEKDFAVNEFISTNNKQLFTKETEAEAIEEKILLNKLAYILVLENQSE